MNFAEHGLGSSYLGLSEKQVEEKMFRDASFANIIDGHNDYQAAPVSTKMAGFEHFKNEMENNQRPDSGYTILTRRPHSVNIEVSELLDKTHSNNGQPIWSTGNHLNVPGMNLIEPRQQSPTGRASPMLHRARSPVTEKDHQLPPVGEAKERQIF